MSDTDPTGASGGADEVSPNEQGSSEEGTEPSGSAAESPENGTPSAGSADESSGGAEERAGATEPSGGPVQPSGAAAGAGGEPGPEETPPVGSAVTPVTAATPATLESSSMGPPPATKKPRARRTRGVISWILIVLASLLIPISVMSAWAIRTVTNTDQYVATMAPLARDPVIVTHLANKATEALFSSHAVEKKIKAALPKKAAPLITPIRAQVMNYVHGLALKVFESPKFGALWDRLNRRSHAAVVSVLEGKHNATLQKFEKNGQIVIDVSPAVQQIIDKANARGIKIFRPVKTVANQSEKGVSFTVVSVSQVSKWSGAFNVLVKLGWAVPVIAIVLGILAIVVAVGRRRALLRVAVGVALITLVLLTALALGRNIFLEKVAQHSYQQDVAASVWDTLLRNLKTDFRWMLLVSVLVAFVAWVFGPARWAGAIRSACARAGRWTAAQARQISGKSGEAAAGSAGARRTGGWILEHINLLRIVGVGVAALILLFAGNLTGWSLLIIVIVLAVYLALIQLVAVWARRVSGGAPQAPATPGVS
jgi:hypothetical protein